VTVFDAYARYYDLLYRDKDYAAEARYVAGLLSRHAPSARSLLDVGCGTGRHARHLAELGYTVHGIDRSASMLATAASLRETLPNAVRGRLSFSEGDARSYRANRRYDAVLALFHVASYQTEAEDLHGLFETAAEHLAGGAVFIFDFWYGPAVLTVRPEVRVKRLEDDHVHVTRIAEPTLHADRNRVDVHYQVFVRDRASGAVHVVEETHRMRYLFQPEVEACLERERLDRVAVEEWLTARAPGLDTWGVCCVGRKRG
jgi:SAM-dependent methyltransferase